MVYPDPPTNEPAVPDVVNPPLNVGEEVATLCIEFVPLPYKSCPAVYVAGVYGPTRDKVTEPVEADALI